MSDNYDIKILKIEILKKYLKPNNSNENKNYILNEDLKNIDLNDLSNFRNYLIDGKLEYFLIRFKISYLKEFIEEFGNSEWYKNVIQSLNYFIFINDVNTNNTKVFNNNFNNSYEIKDENNFNYYYEDEEYLYYLLKIPINYDIKSNQEEIYNIKLIIKLSEEDINKISYMTNIEKDNDKFSQGSFNLKHYFSKNEMNYILLSITKNYKIIDPIKYSMNISNINNGFIVKFNLQNISEETINFNDCGIIIEESMENRLNYTHKLDEIFDFSIINNKLKYVWKPNEKLNIVGLLTFKKKEKNNSIIVSIRNCSVCFNNMRNSTTNFINDNNQILSYNEDYTKPNPTCSCINYYSKIKNLNAIIWINCFLNYEDNSNFIIRKTEKIKLINDNILEIKLETNQNIFKIGELITIKLFIKNFLNCPIILDFEEDCFIFEKIKFINNSFFKEINNFGHFVLFDNYTKTVKLESLENKVLNLNCIGIVPGYVNIKGIKCHNNLDIDMILFSNHILYIK